jgi:uncharacterized membrane protein (UPF0127 family)
MRVRSILAFVIVTALSGIALADSLPTVQLTINGHRLVAEIAATVETRTVGLMHRFSLKPDHGMLFVFNAPQPLTFWMKNTFVPLSIAYIGADGKILNIDDMAPQTETGHSSQGLALSALEMKKGWFADRGIGAGSRVEGLDKAPKTRE